MLDEKIDTVLRKLEKYELENPNAVPRREKCLYGKEQKFVNIKLLSLSKV